MRGALLVIILINVAVFLLRIPPESSLALWPLGPLFRPWQVVTYAFLHEGLAHLFFNMFALYMFGRALQDRWGSARFTTYYFVCVIAAAATQLAVEYGGGAQVPTVGASGAVFGVLLAFGLYYPRDRIFVLPIPIPIPAWLFVTLYGTLELYLGVTGTQSGVAHFAHLGGMLGGAVLLLYDKMSPPGDAPRGPYGPSGPYGR
jgi:membrane associated rhomboid family serine protease